MLTFESEGGSTVAVEPVAARAIVEDERAEEADGCVDPYWQNVLAALAVGGGDSRVLAAAAPGSEDDAAAAEIAPEQTGEGPSAFSF